MLDDGTFVTAEAEFVEADFLAVSPAEVVFTFVFSLSPLSFWTMFAYEDVAVGAADDDTVLVVDSSLVAAEIADILSSFTRVFFDCRCRLCDSGPFVPSYPSNQCLGNFAPTQNTVTHRWFTI